MPSPIGNLTPEMVRREIQRQKEAVRLANQPLMPMMEDDLILPLMGNFSAQNSMDYIPAGDVNAGASIPTPDFTIPSQQYGAMARGQSTPQRKTVGDYATEIPGDVARRVVDMYLRGQGVGLEMMSDASRLSTPFVKAAVNPSIVWDATPEELANVALAPSRASLKWANKGMDMAANLMPQALIGERPVDLVPPQNRGVSPIQQSATDADMIPGGASASSNRPRKIVSDSPAYEPMLPDFTEQDFNRTVNDDRVLGGIWMEDEANPTFYLKNAPEGTPGAASMTAPDTIGAGGNTSLVMDTPEGLPSADYRYMPEMEIPEPDMTIDGLVPQRAMVGPDGRQTIEYGVPQPILPANSGTTPEELRRYADSLRRTLEGYEFATTPEQEAQKAQYQTELNRVMGLLSQLHGGGGRPTQQTGGIDADEEEFFSDFNKG